MAERQEGGLDDSPTEKYKSIEEMQQDPEFQKYLDEPSGDEAMDKLWASYRKWQKEQGKDK